MRTLIAVSSLFLSTVALAAARSAARIRAEVGSYNKVPKDVVGSSAFKAYTFYKNADRLYHKVELRYAHEGSCQVALVSVRKTHNKPLILIATSDGNGAVWTTNAKK